MYYIILDPNGGTGERLYEERGKNTVYYPVYTSFTKSGYVFLGCAERKTAETVLYAHGSPIPVTDNPILYAVWMPESETYTVTFDLKGGIDNGMPKKLSCRPGGFVLLPSLNNTYKAGFVRDGYSPDGTATSGLLKAEMEFFPTTDTTLCVVWGVHYGSDGFIDRLYITDSAVANENNSTSSYGGLQYTPVTYGTHGTPYIDYNQGYDKA